jgi:hypothetical protein
VWTADADADDRPQTLATLAGSSIARASRAQALQGTRYAIACGVERGTPEPACETGGELWPAAPSASVCVELAESRRWAPSDGLIVVDHNDCLKPVVAHKYIHFQLRLHYLIWICDIGRVIDPGPFLWNQHFRY